MLFPSPSSRPRIFRRRSHAAPRSSAVVGPASTRRGGSSSTPSRCRLRTFASLKHAKLSAAARYSVDVQDLTLDIGAYRFGKGMHLPGDLIQNVYNLSLACYEPSCTPDPEFNQVLYKIVDADGHNAGYATPMSTPYAQGSRGREGPHLL